MPREEIIGKIFVAGTYTDPKPAIGRAIIRALLDSGATDKAALWVYQSKHVRWFFDSGKPKTGKEAYDRFKEYIAKDSNGLRAGLSQDGLTLP